MLEESHPPLDKRLARLADRQHGVVSVAQLAELGLSAAAAHERVKTGRLHRVGRGVYAVGRRRLDTRGRWLAAVLSAGPTAVLSHRAAAALWDLSPRPSGAIDVTVPARGRRSRPGIRLHCVRHLEPADVCIFDAIPVTTTARTLLDLAETLDFPGLLYAIEASERLERFDLLELQAVIRRNPGRRGVKPLTEALASYTGEIPWTRSEFERAMLSLIRSAGLPEPQCNVFVAGELVDFFWPQAGLVVEADSWGFHRTRARFEDDRRRDAKLLLRGIQTLRLTQRRMIGETQKVQGELAALLRRAA